MRVRTNKGNVSQSGYRVKWLDTAGAQPKMQEDFLSALEYPPNHRITATSSPPDWKHKQSFTVFFFFECLNTNCDSWSTISETINTCSQCIHQARQTEYMLLYTTFGAENTRLCTDTLFCQLSFHIYTCENTFTSIMSSLANQSLSHR